MMIPSLRPRGVAALLTLGLLCSAASAQTAVFHETEGFVVMEAEHPSARHEAIVTSLHEWSDITYADASGGSLQSLPDSTHYTTDLTGPRADYLVNFETTGIYYVWLRLAGPNSSGNSVIAGFNGASLTNTSGNLGMGVTPDTAFHWVNTGTNVDPTYGSRVTLDVTSTGPNVINIWMREDGAIVDKILLTQDSGYTPTDIGPAESRRTAPGCAVIAFDGFDDGERATDGSALPLDTLAWYCSSSGSLLNVASQALKLTPGSATSRHATAYFPRQLLSEGESLTLSFDFSVTAPANVSSGLRFGLFDSEGSTNYLNADTDNADVTYTGYAAFTNLAPSSSNPLSLRRRDASGSGTALITQTTDYSILGSAGGPTTTFSPGVTYHATLSITQSGSSTADIKVLIEGGGLSGYTLSRSDSGTAPQFDNVTLALYASGGVAPATDITVDNVAVVYTGTTLLTESFSDGNRTGQSLPTSSAWFVDAASAASVSSLNPALSVDTDLGNAAVTYFTTDGFPRELVAGQSLRADFTLRVDGSSFPADLDFLRLALLNSAANEATSAGRNNVPHATPSPSNRIAADGFTPAMSQLYNYAGYLATISLNPADAEGLCIYYRDIPTDRGLFDTVFAYREIGAYAGTGAYGLVPGETYRVTLTVQHTTVGESTVTFTLAGNFAHGGTGEWAVTSVHPGSRAVWVFDTLGVYGDSDAGVGGFTIDDLSITQFNHPGYPYIAENPASVIANPGDTGIGFSITLESELAGAASFEWYKDAVLISGASSSSYTIPHALTEADEAVYTVLAETVAGISTASASLTVNDPPTVVTGSNDVDAYAGDSVLFRVIANGSRPTTYQWKRNGTPLAGEIYPELRLDNITAPDAGTYQVTITTPGGSVTDDAVLTVLGGMPPIVINSATSAAGSAGTLFSYQITTTAPHTPTTYAASGLPAGLVIDTATGLIEGRPTSSGSASVTLSATNASGTDNETLSLTLVAAPTPYTTVAAFEAAFASASAGDVIVLADGTYHNAGRIDIPGTAGTASAPIIARAETPGGVTFTGQAQIRVGRPSTTAPEPAHHVIVEGFRFADGQPQTNSNGFTSSGAIYLFGEDLRATECTIIDYNDNVDPSLTVNWVTIDGDRIRVDHCYFEGKRGNGPLITIRRTVADADFHRIDHNAFIDFQTGATIKDNGLETIRLGDSSNSLTDSFSTIEWNYFEACNGDAEIVSNKSGRNTYRYNTFINCTGQLSLRIGPGCIVESNFIQQDGSAAGQGGIRASDRDHVIRYNYVQGAQSSAFLSGIGLFATGTGNLGSASYWPVDDVIVSHNTLVDCEASFTHGGGSGTIAPEVITFIGNAARSGLVDPTTHPIVDELIAIDSPSYAGEIYYGGTSGNIGLSPVPAGVTDSAPSLSSTTLGGYTVYLASPGNEGTDVNHLFPLVAADVGPLDYTP